jgi:hypothetical protein
MQVMPQLSLVTDSAAHSAILKLLAETSVNSGDLAQPLQAIANVYERLIVSG